MALPYCARHGRSSPGILANRRISGWLHVLKPTISLPFAALLLVRRQWPACAIVAICAGAWYLASVAATAGDWAWIPRYVAVMRTLHDVDMGALYNGHHLTDDSDTPGNRAGSCSRAWSNRIRLLAAGVIGGKRLLLAMSCTSVLSVALSAHAWMYDAAIVLPALFYAMAKVAEPWRTRLIVAAYLLAALWMLIDAAIRFNPLAIITLGGAALCVVSALPQSETAAACGLSLAT